MTCLISKSLKETAWRGLFRLKAKRAFNEAQSILSQKKECPREQLESFLLFPWWQVRNLAIKIVKQEKNKTFAPFIHDLLRNRTDTGIVRRNSISTLLELDDNTDSILETLTACLEDPYWEVKSEAIAALSLQSSLPKDTLQVLFKLVQRERSFEVKISLARILGRSGDPDAFLPLFSLTKNRSWLVRLQSSVALVELVSTLSDLRPKVLQILKNLENICAGVTGRMLFQDHLFSLEKLVSRNKWPEGEALQKLYLIHNIPWTRQ